MKRTALAVSSLLAFAACAPQEASRPAGDGVADTTFAIPVEWLADSARTSVLEVDPPPAVWVARVSPAPAPPPAPVLPDALPSVPETPPAPPALEIDPGLKPPIPKRVARIAHVPGAGPASVELDVRVDAAGHVADVIWVGGARDSAQVAAAIACAYAMEFFPAMRAGEPVGVWCRQRFDFPAR